jgi:hypothetical protein
MKDITSHIKKAANEIMLSHDERTHMKHVVREYMSMKPLPRQSASVSIQWFSFSWIQRPLAAALALVFIFGSGISYASESALPGDALYSVKTRVNEPIKVALASGAEAKANVQMELAERRIDEAATLASENRLDAKTQDQLAAAFEAHAQSATEEVASIEDDSSTAAELTSRFETRLAAHQDVLEQVQEQSGEPGTLAIAIRGAGLAVADIRARAEARSSVSSPAVVTMAMAKGPAPMETMSLKVAINDVEQPTATAPVPEETNYDARTAERMRISAEAQLKAAQKKLKSAKLEDSERAQAEAELSQAQELIVNGKVLLSDKAAAHAYHSFQDSLIISGKMSVMLDSSVALKKAGVKTAAAQGADAARAKVRAAVSASVNAQATATMNAMVAPADVDVHAAASAAADIVNVIPPTLQIFKSNEEGKDSDSGGEGHGLIHIGL